MQDVPENLSIKDYTYPLPEEKIAKYPLAERDESKLLIYKNGSLQEDTYKFLPKYLPEDSLLIFNNTRVVEARLYFQKAAGTPIEIFCLEPADDYKDITTAMLQQNRVRWQCLIGGAKKWKEDILEKRLFGEGEDIILRAKKLGRIRDAFLIEFSWAGSYSFADILHIAGEMPLPPYLKRNSEDSDKIRYQTVYAAQDGSVAAPTAGLHFTEALLQKLSAKHIQTQFVTLHVGAGTFKPVKSETMRDHEMHAEFFEVSAQLLQSIIGSKNKIVAVGTTSARTLESLYWLGVKLLHGKQPETLQQWEAYTLPQHYTKQESFSIILQFMQERNWDIFYGKTQLIIAPGYTLKVVDALITNFHQPGSTLLLLVAAIVGNDWKKIYNYALNNSFRFLSYGDGCLLWRS